MKLLNVIRGLVNESISNFSDSIVDYIASKESFKPKPYKDSGGLLTIGYGTRLKYYPELLKKKEISRNEAKQYLKKHINSNVISAITNYVKVPLDQNKFDALVSLIYNIGRKNFINSELLNKINSLDDYGIKREWLKWNKDRKGNVLNGLNIRRQEELDLFGRFVK